MPSATTINRVKTIIRESLKLSPDVILEDQMPLIGGDHDFDSLDVLLVVTNVEKEFGIKIPDQKIGQQVFASVLSLTQFVETQIVETTFVHPPPH